MKKIKEVVEYLGFEEETKAKVGRPKLADAELKRKSLLIASLSFFGVIMLLVFGYGTLFGFKNLNLSGLVANNSSNEEVLITEIKPLIDNITIKVGTARKVYLTVLPASATNKVIEYESSNPKVASVDKDGKVTGISEGSATIKAYTTDGSDKTATFNVKVIKNASGSCFFQTLSKTAEGINYEIKCSNAKIKDVQYKIENGNYEKLLSKKTSGTVLFSKEQLKEKITFKVVYYPNSSKVTKYSTKVYDGNKVTTTKKIEGSCNLNILSVNSNSAKYDISCDNASITKIAYKIGNGSYVGIDKSSLADTILFEESDVTRQIYFNIEYMIDGTDKIKTVTKSSIIEKGNPTVSESGVTLQ